MTYVFAFDHKHRKPPMSYKDLLGGKGANLAEMTSVLGLPVPPGFTISTDACRDYMYASLRGNEKVSLRGNEKVSLRGNEKVSLRGNEKVSLRGNGNGAWPKDLDDEIAKQRTKLEKAMGKKIGDPADPLLVSVRSGAKFSMPGMMDTVLNLGLNDESVEGLAKQTDERFAYDSYRRFIAMYGRIVLGVEGEDFERLLDTAREWDGARSDSDISPDTLRRLCLRYKEVVARHTGSSFPQDPTEQLRGAVEAVFKSWNGPRAIAYRNREKISHDLGTAVNVQTMVFGNRDENSGTGVGFTRNPSTGENKAYGDFLVNAQGEDVVAGIRNTEPLEALQEKFPKIHKELLGIFERLEKHYQDMCDTEFTIEQGKLWMLQTRVGKRTGAAALRMAVEMTKQKGWKISKEEAVQRVTADHLDSVLHPQFAAGSSHKVLTRGLAASPGAAVGRVYFTADDAVDAVERGEQVILVRNETSPEDVHGMAVAEGILTAKGGLVSHAAVVARGWGKPAVCGAEAVKITGKSFVIDGTVFSEGEVISLDGSTGAVVQGEVALSVGSTPDEFDVILSWADKIRQGGKGVRGLKVRANADTGEDAARARDFGAEGIGLCRTEHMFLGEDRLPIVRQMIMASTVEEEEAALANLLVAQKADFIELLEAMDGLPVTVRLLDPPLHEFLPDVEELAVKEAVHGLDAEETALLAAARSWQEVNPMLGTRGVRLGVVKPGLYAMQVRALMEAATARLEAKGNPVVEIMIPLTISREEMALARSWVEDAITQAAGSAAGKMDVTIGTMIEVPRAALRAEGVAEFADFFSFGTNDLTQMALGFSRDDIEGRIMTSYVEHGLLKTNPFETLDILGVGELVRLAVERGRKTRPDIKLGVCGEHGGDPESIYFFYETGLDYVSCSPFRVPIARLAAAQAVLGAGSMSDTR